MAKESGTRIIFHIDVNSAFLSWSAVKRLEEEPGSVDLRTIPSIVGGDIATRHGIVTAKSIPAKKLGIETAEPVARALQKCPNLVIVRSDFETYRKYSRAFIAILRQYAPVVEQASIDEAFADMTEVFEAYEKGGAALSERMPGPGLDRREFALEMARRIRDEVRESLGFTVNVGISVNKLLAKMASDFTKPDRTHTLYPSEIPDKMWPLPVGDLFGCGRKTAERLASLGVSTIGDAASLPLEVLQTSLGEKSGEYIFRSVRGKGSDRVSDEREDAKSYSNEVTTASDITAENYSEEMPPLLKALSQKVASRLRRDHVYARTIGVMVKTNDFRRRSMQQKAEDSTNSEEVLLRIAASLMEKLLLGDNGLLSSDGSGIRLVGICAADLDDGNFRQMNLMDYLTQALPGEPAKSPSAEPSREYTEDSGGNMPDKKRPDERLRRLTEMSRKINERYGENTVRRGAGKRENK